MIQSVPAGSKGLDQGCLMTQQLTAWVWQLGSARPQIVRGVSLVLDSDAELALPHAEHQPAGVLALPVSQK